MAEYFGDKESMKKILGAYSNKRVRKIADRIAGFNAAIWEQVGPFELWTVSSAHMVDALLLIVCACLGSAMTGASVLLFYGYMASSFQVKQSVWEAGQRLKFEQIGWIAKVLVCTGNAYIAVCERDKVSWWLRYRSLLSVEESADSYVLSSVRFLLLWVASIVLELFVSAASFLVQFNN